MSSAKYSCKLFKPIFAYRQTVKTLIRLLLQEQSDLGLHCLQKWLLKSQADDIPHDNYCDWPPSSFHTDCSKVVPLLQFFFVHWWFQRWRHFVIVPHVSFFWCFSGFKCGVVLSLLFLMSHSFGASGKLCFMTVAFPRYLHLYFWHMWSIFHQKISWLTVCVPAHQTPSIKESKFSQSDYLIWIVGINSHT